MTGRNWYAWEEVIARLRTKPGRWELSYPDVPARTAATVRLRRATTLRRNDGHLECDLRNRYVTEDGQTRGDLYLRWVPDGPPGGTLADTERRVT